MKTEQLRWSPINGWEKRGTPVGERCSLVTVFYDHPTCRTSEWFDELRDLYPDALIVGASSSGSISGTLINDESAEITAVRLECSHVKMAVEEIGSYINGVELGKVLGGKLEAEGLKHVFVLSDGLSVNGSDLAEGLVQSIPDGVVIAGGLAGDGARFESTSIIANAPAKSGIVALIGFYGETLQAKTGCFAGWEEFGAERIITRSVGNVLYEIDGKPALELYKSYLGEFASGLPGSGLRFPMSVRKNTDTVPVIRTILAVDEETQSMTFAGDMPAGNLCRLMKTNMDLLIENAGMAARASHQDHEESFLVLMVSCVGRRLVLGQLCEEELEIIRETLGEQAVMSGFYSYGELSPSGVSACSLHNQTMTLVSIYE